MSNVQFSKAPQHQELCITMQEARTLVAKSLFYTAIFFVLFGVGQAKAALAPPPINSTITYTPPGEIVPRELTPSQPPTVISCTSPDFIKCDGINDKTCTKRCDAGLNAFPTRNQTIYNYKTKTYSTSAIHNEVSATGYNVYDIICPSGYAAGNPRVLAGAVVPREINIPSMAQVNTLRSRGYNCYQGAQAFYFVQGPAPVTVNTDVTEDAEYYGQPVLNGVGAVTGWTGDGQISSRALHINGIYQDQTVCTTWSHYYQALVAAGPMWHYHGIADYVYDSTGTALQKKYCSQWHSWGSFSYEIPVWMVCWQGHNPNTGASYCSVYNYRYIIDAAPIVCDAPFYPQGEPIIKNVCIFTGTNWKSQQPVSTGTTNCVPRATGTKASAAHICPPTITPQTPGPASEDTPAL